MLKPADIFTTRGTKLTEWISSNPVPVAASLASGSTSQPTVNTPEAAVFTIVSWNIQDFHESKVYANPFANSVIQQVIRAISADLVVIVESQLAPSTIVSGVEHGYANPIGTDWEAEDGVVETVDEYLKRVVDSSPMPDYYGIGSEITHKRDEVPAQFAGADMTAFYWTPDGAPNVLPWKSYYVDAMIESVLVPLPLKKFYTIHFTETNNEVTFDEFVAMTASSKKEIDFRLRSGVPMTDEEAGVISDVLVALGVFRPDKESYALLFAWQRDPVKDIPVMPADPVQAQGKQVWVNGFQARLVYKDTSGKDAGFQTPNDVTKNFRAPYLVPIQMQLMDGKPYTLPLLAFHAPWEGGMKARTSAFTSILDVDVAPPSETPAPLAVKDCESAIIVGDFNLEYKTGKSGPAKAFGEYGEAGFLIANRGGKTSLKALFKKKTTTLEATPNQNYDHILIKGAPLQQALLQAGVIDVPGHLADYVTECRTKGIQPPLNDGDTDDVNAWTTYTADELGRFIYRKYVSDHLPVFADFVVMKTPKTAPVDITLGPLPPPVSVIRTEIAVNIDTAELLPGVQVTRSVPLPENTFDIVALVVAKFMDGVYAVAPHPITHAPSAFFIPAKSAETLRVSRYIHVITEFDAQPRGMKQDLLLPFEQYVIMRGDSFSNATLVDPPNQTPAVLQLTLAGFRVLPTYRIRGRVVFVSKKMKRIWIATAFNTLVDLPQADPPNELVMQQWVQFEAALAPVGPTLAPSSYSQ